MNRVLAIVLPLILTACPPDPDPIAINIDAKANEAFEHFEAIEPRGEGMQILAADPPQGVELLIGMQDDGDEGDGLIIRGTLPANQYEFELTVDHYVDGPDSHKDLFKVTINVEE